MLRLTTTRTAEDGAVLAVHGSIDAEGLPSLARETEALTGEGHAVTLELSGVRFIDLEGLSRLRRWVDAGIELRGGSAFIRALLQEHGFE